MEGHHYQAQPMAGQRMSRLYVDAKRTYQAVANAFAQPEDAPEIASLHRKSRMQKDRLIAWGLEWQDQNAQGLIDETITKAGLEEIVTSCLENIKNTIDEMDKLASKASNPRAPQHSAAGFPLEKQSRSWSGQDRREYEELVNSLTSTIDLLCDLSRQHRPQTPPQGSDEKKGLYPSDEKKNPYASEKKRMAYPEKPTTTKAKSFPQYPTAAQRQMSQGATTLDAFKLKRSDLLLPEEAPPPFEDEGLVEPARVVGRMRVGNPSSNFKGGSHTSTTIPVIVEYAEFDRMYQETGVPLPYRRVEEFAALVGTDQPQTALPKLIGFFEDSLQSRVGFVYELPQQVRADLPNSAMKPASLCELLRSVSKQQNYVIPDLEHRFKTALELVSGTKFLLNMGFPHRGINSASAYFFPQASTARGGSTTPALNFDIRQPMFSGVDFFSEFNIDTLPESVHQNIYRHPDDPRVRGPTSTQTYESWLDVYSLGLVLLEIGLWMPLADLYKEKYSLPDFQVRVEKIWLRKLAGKCGGTYMRAVQDLLAARDADYLQQLEKAVGRLERCCILDSDDDSTPITTQPLTAEPEEVETAERAALSRSFSDAKSTDVKWPSPMPSLPKKQAVAAAPKNEKQQCECIIADKLQSFGAKLTTENVRQTYDQLMCRVSPFMDRIFRDKPEESFLICLDMLGESKAQAQPYIHICCSNTKLVYAAFRKFFKVDAGTHLGIAVSKGESNYSKAPADSRSSAFSEEFYAKNPHFYERPSCGSSIGAFLDDEHLPPVSFGGVVLVDGKPFGMTVHHLIENPSASPPPVVKRAPETTSQPPAQTQRSFQMMPSFEEFDDEEDLVDALDDLDLDDDMLSDLSRMGSLDENAMEVEPTQPLAEGDTPGIMRGRGTKIRITQPALDDMPEGYYPCEEDEDEEHLMSHELGNVWASSGLRRLNVAGKNHEIDWLLLELKDDRIQPANVVPGSRLYWKDNVPPPPADLRQPVARPEPFKPNQDGYPHLLMPYKDMAGRAVHCFGRTSGLAGGEVTPVMGTTKFKGRTTSADVWLVEGDFGAGGDSGAWVFDNEEGRVAGYVLGRNTRLKAAVIAPMEIVFDDIKRTLGAQTVSLPGAPADSSPLAGSRNEAANNLVKDAEARPGAGRISPGRAQSLLAAQSFLLSGRPGHLEREWSARRRALGTAGSGS